jgi:hypothetical protein
MNENEDSLGALGMSNDELLKVVVDKVIDNGTAIKEAREQMRKLAVQNEAMEDMQLQMERLEKNLGTISKTVASNHNVTNGEMIVNRQEMRSRIDSLEKKVDPERVLAGMVKLEGELRKHIEYFEEPSYQEIHDEHFLGWPPVILVVLVILVGVLMFAWLHALSKAC